MKYITAILGVAVLGGCLQVAGDAEQDLEAPIVASGDSNVRFLTPGMPQAQVNRIIGAHQAESFDSTDATISCRSYVYDETLEPKFVHVYFKNSVVATASDGHQGTCPLS